MNANIIQKAVNMISNPGQTATIGLIDEEGRPCVSAISCVGTDRLDVCWFSTNPDGRKANLIAKNNSVGICFFDDGNVSLTGRAEMVTDPQLKKDMWLPWFINHYKEGPEDENYALIKVTVEHVRLYIDGEGADFNIADIRTVQSYCGLLCDGCGFRVPYHCGKCIATKGNPFHGQCPVAVCCIERGYQHCGMCPDMPCDKLYQYSCSDDKHSDTPKGARLEMLKYWKANK